MPCWPCGTSPVMTAGRKAGPPSAGCGASRRRPHEPNGRFIPLPLTRGSHVRHRRGFPHLSPPRPLSQRPHRFLPPSRRRITHGPHHLNLVRCVLLRPIRGDALSSAVVPLSREVWVLQKSHAHPLKKPISPWPIGGICNVKK